mgnify:CR=1 FL=1
MTNASIFTAALSNGIEMATPPAAITKATDSFANIATSHHVFTIAGQSTMHHVDLKT